MCWPVIMFESFLSIFKNVNLNIYEFHLVEEQSSACAKGGDGHPDHHPISHLGEHTALQGIPCFFFAVLTL